MNTLTYLLKVNLYGLLFVGCHELFLHQPARQSVGNQPLKIARSNARHLPPDNVVSLADSVPKPQAAVTIHGKGPLGPLGTEPLYIVDGTPSTGEAVKNLDAKTIESVNVLQGESATATYGAKGKDGVVIVTLRKK